MKFTMDEAVEINQNIETEKGYVLVKWIEKVLRDKVVLWDIRQRLQALRKSKYLCYVGLLLTMVQGIAHSSYKAFLGVHPVFMDKFASVFLAVGYYITLVWTVGIYLALLWFSFISSCSVNKKALLWSLRLDTIFLHLLLFLAPFSYLVLAVQLTVTVTYPFVYKKVLYNNFMHGIDEYYSSSQVREFIDYIQESYKCCGFYNYQDWIKQLRVREHGQFPFSCCQKGFVCEKENIVNFLGNYKKWYETEYYVIKLGKVRYKDITFISKALFDVKDDGLPFIINGCAERLLDSRPFYWPMFFYVIQFIIMIQVLMNIRRNSTSTVFARRTVEECPKDYIMLSLVHACPCWTLVRPTEEALLRWQRNYLVMIYFYLVYTGKLNPNKYHEAFYPAMRLTAPNFNKSFDKRVRVYLRFLRLMIGKRKTVKVLFV